MSLLKNLVAVSDVPSTADKSAVTVTAPVVAELGVKLMYVPSVVSTESTDPPPPPPEAAIVISVAEFLVSVILLPAVN